ncbi:MAG: DNA polymerase III subunit chi [Acidovorax sp.]|jgi:DNA polymerase-3 subunit chi
MTDVAFHFNARDKPAHACRFTRKAQRSGSRRVFMADADTLAASDRMLWLMAPQDFVAHCISGAGCYLVRASPVFLREAPLSSVHHDNLLKLMRTVAQGFDRFYRWVEVVSAQRKADRARARNRWQYYESCGYAITSHDLVLKGN